MKKRDPVKKAAKAVSKKKEVASQMAISEEEIRELMCTELPEKLKEEVCQEVAEQMGIPVEEVRENMEREEAIIRSRWLKKLAEGCRNPDA